MINFITKVITFIGGLYFFLEFILPKKFSVFQSEIFFGKYHDQISLSLVLISCVAVGLGVINILTIHGSVILSKKSGFSSSLVLILSFFFSLFIQSASWINKESYLSSWKDLDALATYVSKNPDASLEKLDNNLKIVLENNKIPEGVNKESYLLFISNLRKDLELNLNTNKDIFPSSLKEIISNKISEFKNISLREYEEISGNSFYERSEKIILNGLFFPLGASMFSLLAFYISYAAYRSFRIRSLEAACMMLAALLIILGQIPQGSIYISESLPEFRLWIMENLSTPALRAIAFGSAVAGLSLSLRMWLSMDKGSFN